MDYSRFRFRAVVDWIELEIHTAKPTNFPKVQRILREIFGLSEDKKPPFAQPLNEGAGGAATVFRFRIYDPKNWHQVTEILQKLAQTFSFTELPRVTAIEIALDAYSKGEATSYELAELVANYYRSMTRPVSNNRRLYRHYKGGVQPIPQQFLSLVRHVSEGWQIAIGDKEAEQYQHMYFKTADQGKPLSENEHRARIEVTLRGDKLPHQSLEESQVFDFTSVSGYFKFRNLTDELSSLLATRSQQIGEKKQHNRRGGGTRLYLKPTEADAVLNRKAYDALRDLSRRWK